MASNEPVRTLVLSAQTDVVEQLQQIFASEPSFRLQFTPSAERAVQILAQNRVDIILVDDVLSDSAPLESVRILARTFPQVPIVTLVNQTAVSYVRESLLAGARAFLSKPLQESETITTITQIIQMETMRQGQASTNGVGMGNTPAKKSHIIAVMSPKGGVGVTMLALNLATLLRTKTKSDVVLMESQSSLGDLEPAASLQARFTLGDMLHQGRRPDSDLISGALVEHGSGLRVLVSSRKLEDNGLMSADSFEHVVDHLTDIADYVVIDTGTIGEDQTAAALAIADTVFLMTTPEIPCLRRVALFLEAADRGGFPREKLHLIVNRDGAPGGISSSNISQNLNMQIAAAIPDDPALVTYAYNRGTPLVLSDGRSAVARSIEKLVETLIPTPKAIGQIKSKAPSGLMGRLGTMLNFSPA